MEISRLRLLFLTATLGAALSGCSMFGGSKNDAPPEAVPAAAETATTGEPASDRSIIEPEVERREIKRSRIDSEDFEIGLYAGILSIEDFESHSVFGGRFAYHLTEDFFLEATAGQSKAGRTSFENLSGSADILDDDDTEVLVLRALDRLECVARRGVHRQGPRIQQRVLLRGRHRQHHVRRR